MTIHDNDTETPSKYEYTKHNNEEETIERMSSVSASEQHQTHPMTAFIRSSEQYENIQIRSRGDNSSAAEQQITVKVSRQRKEQSIHISNGKKRSPRKATKSSNAAVATRGSGKGGECLRRIKREWKDAVKMGVAYDWINMRTINNAQHNKNNDYVRIGPFGKNLLRWHFSVAGPSSSVYEGGVYHGRVLLPKDYPGNPPRVQMLTPSGRFVCGADICLSASSYHPETWTPRWTVLSLVDALRLHMLTTANEIGGVMASSERRREYARESRSWRSPGLVDHGRMVEEGIFPLRRDEDETVDGPSEDDVSESNEMQQHALGVHPQKKATKSATKKRHNNKQSHIRSPKTSRKSIAATVPNDVGSFNSTEQRGIISILLKRVIIEMLKLPLRMLSILLRILSGMESLLTAIVDSL